LRRILKARQAFTGKETIRSFMSPKINFEAKDYTEMITWNDRELSPTPIIRDISDEEIEMHIEFSTVPNWEFKKFPCHTQTVERCVKLVTEASQNVCGPESRDGYIRSTLLSRSV